MWENTEEMRIQKKLGYSKEYTEKYTKFSKIYFKTQCKKYKGRKKCVKVKKCEVISSFLKSLGK